MMDYPVGAPRDGARHIRRLAGDQGSREKKKVSGTIV
jgi:hypothetical protein